MAKPPLTADQSSGFPFISQFSPFEVSMVSELEEDPKSSQRSQPHLARPMKTSALNLKTPSTASETTPNTSPSPLSLPLPILKMKRRSSLQGEYGIGNYPVHHAQANAMTIPLHSQYQEINKNTLGHRHVSHYAQPPKALYGDTENTSCSQNERAIDNRARNRDRSYTSPQFHTNQESVDDFAQMSSPLLQHDRTSDLQACLQPDYRIGSVAPTSSTISGYTFIQRKLTQTNIRHVLRGANAVEALRKIGVTIDGGAGSVPFERTVSDELKATVSRTNRGVVKIGNIPFTVTLQEVKDFVKRQLHPHPASTQPSNAFEISSLQPNDQSYRNGNGGMLDSHVQGYPIHIIMEKPTGKTMDAFVEFEDEESARKIVRNFDENVQLAMSSGAVLPAGYLGNETEHNSNGQQIHTNSVGQHHWQPQGRSLATGYGRSSDRRHHFGSQSVVDITTGTALSRIKLGIRIVSLELSTQSELLSSIFPRARLVSFHHSTGIPTIETDPAVIEESGWTEGFRGYFTMEEIYGVVRFAENPSRSPFAAKCHQRVYECMISTLYKFPWTSTETYSVGARDMLFSAVCQQMKILVTKVGPPPTASVRNDIQAVFSRTAAFPRGASGGTGDSNTGIFHPDNYLTNENVQQYGYQPNLRSNWYSSNPQVGSNLSREVGLSTSLLMDLLFAGLNVPCFSLLQRAHLCNIAGDFGAGVPLSYFSQCWPFSTLNPRHDASDESIKFYLELFDTGFDAMEQSGDQTSYEKYARVSRNHVGFPVVEWTTRRGTELSFEEAMMIETELAKMYLEKGKQLWCYERGIPNATPFSTLTLEDLIFGISNTNLRDEDTHAKFSQAETQPSTPDHGYESPFIPPEKSFKLTSTSSQLNPLSLTFRPGSALRRDRLQEQGQSSQHEYGLHNHEGSRLVIPDLPIPKRRMQEPEWVANTFYHGPCGIGKADLPSSNRDFHSRPVSQLNNPINERMDPFSAENTSKTWMHDNRSQIYGTDYASEWFSTKNQPFTSSPTLFGEPSDDVQYEDVKARESLGAGLSSVMSKAWTTPDSSQIYSDFHVSVRPGSTFQNSLAQNLTSPPRMDDSAFSRHPHQISPNRIASLAREATSPKNASVSSDPFDTTASHRTPEFGPIGSGILSPPSGGSRSRAATRSKINIDQTIQEEAEADPHHDFIHQGDV